jgi:predicted alpha/beta-fold hydrolase
VPESRRHRIAMPAICLMGFHARAFETAGRGHRTRPRVERVHSGIPLAPSDPLPAARQLRPALTVMTQAARYDPKRPFRPAPWARGPHLQTLGARVLRPSARPPMIRERWTLPDGDFLDVDVAAGPRADAPVALILHGLEGSSRRRYVLSACRELLSSGVRPVALNFRGCSGEMNLLPRFYHSGDTGDAGFALERLRARFPDSRMGAWGFSLGGNALLKLMGERDDGGAGVLEAAVVMSVPFDLAAGSALLEKTRMGRFYAGYFLRSLRRKVRAKQNLLAPLLDVEAALACRTLWSFDDVATAPLHGFRDAAHYYEESSSAAYLAAIRVSTLVLQSRDDPFLPFEALPVRVLKDNPSFRASLTDRGGHVGFLEGTPLRPSFWGDRVGASFLARQLGAPGA